MIAHIVLFQPKTGLTMAERRSFARSVARMCLSSPWIVRSTVGRRTTIDAGYDRIFGDTTYEFAAVLEFDGPESAVSYLASPDHAELGRLFWECCERTVVTEIDVVDLSSESAVDLLAE